MYNENNINMKTLHQILTAAACLAAACLLLGGCGNESEGAGSNAPVPARITSVIDGMSTRASGTAWAPGDRIGITATKADGTVLLSNAPYVTTDGNGTFTPACNHGTVIALKDAHEGVVWSNRKDITVNDWTNSDDRGEDKVDISNLNVFFGYSNTYALRLYNKAHAAGFGIAAVAEVDRYGKSTPAPANSSGWYLPGMELGAEYAHREIEASFQKADGEALDGGQVYWTSIEKDLSIAIATTPTPNYANGWKKATLPVRAMLAF